MTEPLHTEYFIDELGFMMVDHAGMWIYKPGGCFVCRRMTHRFDMTFQAFYCDSRECNEKITEDLEKIPEEPLSDFG